MDAHPCFDYTPANRLRFILRGSTAHRGNEWADLPGRPLEDQLAEIVQESRPPWRSRRTQPPRRRANPGGGTAELRKRRAQSPRRVHPHAYRVKHLEERTDAWHQIKRLTEFVTAVRNRATSLPPG
jgi:hypothetical protein